MIGGHSPGQMGILVQFLYGMILIKIQFLWKQKQELLSNQFWGSLKNHSEKETFNNKQKGETNTMITVYMFSVIFYYVLLVLLFFYETIKMFMKGYFIHWLNMPFGFIMRFLLFGMLPFINVLGTIKIIALFKQMELYGHELSEKEKESK